MLPWPQAIPAIAARAGELSSGEGVVVLGVTGPVGAGKSTLAAAISPCVITTDHYLPNYETLPEHERDLPQHADFPRLARDLASLKARLPTAIPRWSFHTHRREGESVIQPHSIVVVEGIHALHDPLVPHLDLCIYVDAPRALRWRRWEHLEASGQRGWGVAVAREYFDRVAEVTFARYEATYRSRAQFVVLNEQPEL